VWEPTMIGQPHHCWLPVVESKFDSDARFRPNNCRHVLVNAYELYLCHDDVYRDPCRHDIYGGGLKEALLYSLGPKIEVVTLTRFVENAWNIYISK
jgi:hypothetical protein